MIKAEYVDHMGSDLTVVNSARVSFNKEVDSMNMSDVKLITYLADHNHFTPFTHPQITLRETVPIFVARQRFKHVVGFTYNEVSRRYVDDTPEFYEVDEWRERPDKNIKQGSGGAHSASNYYKEKIACHLRACVGIYTDMIKNGVAPEQVRMILPQSMLTSYYVTGSLAAFARLYKLRVDPHAQKEIQTLAHQIGSIIEPLFPVAWPALTAGEY